jgi:subtilisin family serine protease
MLKEVVALLLLISFVQGLVPLYEAASSSVRIEGNYIVVFSSNVSTAELTAFHDRITKSLGVVMDHEWTIMPGFSAKLTPEQLEVLRQEDHLISFIEEDQKVFLDAYSQTCTTESGTIWNLARVSKTTYGPIGSGPYLYNFDGSNVLNYVVDTGIRTTHQEFTGGRAIWGANYVGDGINSDCNGHGTHVAGTIVGLRYGIAKGSTAIAVKVLGCDGSGTNAGVISGVNYASTNCGSRGFAACVANMSLGGGISSALDTAVRNAVNAGISFVLAAGNSNANACNSSPARVGGTGGPAITVAASDQSDRRSSFSNWGTCCDIIAPGSSIYSAWYTSNTAYNTISGTSMASPHVAGVTTLLLDQNPNANPKTLLLSRANYDYIDLACTGTCGTTPNYLVHSSC